MAKQIINKWCITDRGKFLFNQFHYALMYDTENEAQEKLEFYQKTKGDSGEIIASPEAKVQCLRVTLESYDMAWVIDRSWKKLDEPRRCRFVGGHPRKSCHNKAHFALLRSNGYWSYCEEHIQGYRRRIKGDVIEYAVPHDSPAARQGYID